MRSFRVAPSSDRHRAPGRARRTSHRACEHSGFSWCMTSGPIRSTSDRSSGARVLGASLAISGRRWPRRCFTGLWDPPAPIGSKAPRRDHRASTSRECRLAALRLRELFEFSRSPLPSVRSSSYNTLYASTPSHRQGGEIGRTIAQEWTLPSRENLGRSWHPGGR
jgi:hypothetical protein